MNCCSIPFKLASFFLCSWKEKKRLCGISLWLFSPGVPGWRAHFWEASEQHEVTQVQRLLTGFFCFPVWTSLKDSPHHRAAVENMDAETLAKSKITTDKPALTGFSCNLYSLAEASLQFYKLGTKQLKALLETSSCAESISVLNSSVRSLFPLLSQQDGTFLLLRGASC